MSGRKEPETPIRRAAKIHAVLQAVSEFARNRAEGNRRSKPQHVLAWSTGYGKSLRITKDEARLLLIEARSLIDGVLAETTPPHGELPASP